MKNVIRSICFLVILAAYVVGGEAFDRLGSEDETLRVVAHISLMISSFIGLYYSFFAESLSNEDIDSNDYKRGYQIGRIVGREEGLREGFKSAYENEVLLSLRNSRKEEQNNEL